MFSYSIPLVISPSVNISHTIGDPVVFGKKTNKQKYHTTNEILG